MKILFVVPGPIQWATSRFRAYWIQPHIPDSEIVLFSELAELAGDKLREVLEPFDHVIWLKQCPIHALKDNVRDGQKHWWDATDPMWWFSPQWSKEIALFVDGTIVSSQGLGENFNVWKPSQAKLAKRIDDHMNLDHYNVIRKHSNDNEARLIWFGLNANRFTLLSATPFLSRVWANGWRFSLTIMDNAPANDWSGMFEFPVNHVAFDLETEAGILGSHDIAVLPDYPGPWGKCKSTNKKLTAYAAGLPVIVGDDYHRILKLIDMPDMRQQAGDMNRKMVEERYQSERHARILVKILESDDAVF